MARPSGAGCGAPREPGIGGGGRWWRRSRRRQLRAWPAAGAGTAKEASLRSQRRQHCNPASSCGCTAFMLACQREAVLLLRAGAGARTPRQLRLTQAASSPARLPRPGRWCLGPSSRVACEKALPLALLPRLQSSGRQTPCQSQMWHACLLLTCNFASSIQVIYTWCMRDSSSLGLLRQLHALSHWLRLLHWHVCTPTCAIACRACGGLLVQLAPRLQQGCLRS